ncbi:MAG: iron/manganese transporter [Calditrichaeota bacterium]|nr:iron/manganese transporter [Calditrichota bacterium]
MSTISSSHQTRSQSLAEVHASVAIPDKVGLFKRLFAFVGPAYLVSVGYMDPGNWATDIEGGARFGYQLIWVLLMSNLMAVLLQTLAARLGIVSGRDLAQACRESYPRPIGLALWIVCEIAIIATDLAEVLGTAIGLNLLFGIPLLTGVFVTAADVMLLLYFQHLGIRKVEAFILALVATIGGCFLIEIILAKPVMSEVAKGFVPRLSKESLYVAIGILGATVMPHNIYLHSALVQTRDIRRTPQHIAQACKYNLIDSTVALNAAFFVNAAILVMSAAVFHKSGQMVTEIEQAHALLSPLLGTAVASFAFGLALLCSGQSSTLTGTLAGQVVMEGFINFKIKPWVRRLITRSLAIIPAAITIGLMGAEGTYRLLILSQVILSLQLPFAVIPLIHFTSDGKRMGQFANKLWVVILAWLVAAIIVGLNLKLVTDTFGDWIGTAGENVALIWLVALPLAGLIGGLLLYVTFSPFLKEAKRRREAIHKAITTADLRAEPYRRIGVALEATERDRQILAQAIPLATQNEASLILIHVAEGMGPRFWKDESSDAEVAADDSYLKQLKGEIEALGHKVETHLGFGEPSREIIRLAGEANLDLLVMGQHGHRFPVSFFTGSTATPVRRKLGIPVFLVRV